MFLICSTILPLVERRSPEKSFAPTLFVYCFVNVLYPIGLLFLFIFTSIFAKYFGVFVSVTNRFFF